MRARCKSNKGDDYELPYFDPKYGRPDGQIFNLTPGRTYTVYAIGFNGPGTWLYVADDIFFGSPRRYPAILFDLEEPSVSKYWVLTVGHLDSDQPDMMAPIEWGRELWFFNRVVDGEPEAVAIFADMKARLDLEAGASDVT